MTDYEIDIREIKATLKKMQEDIKRLEDSSAFFKDYQYMVLYKDNCPTQACSLEDLERYVI